MYMYPGTCTSYMYIIYVLHACDYVHMIHDTCKDVSLHMHVHAHVSVRLSQPSEMLAERSSMWLRADEPWRTRISTMGPALVAGR